MEKEFVKYMEALALKELGFDEPCFAWYVSEKYGLEFGKVIQSHLIGDAVVAPTYSQAFRFFREKYGLYSCIMYSSDGIIKGGYSPMIDIMKPHKAILDFNNYDTYEEAELECLKKLIEIVKNK
jgi:hypothetical protein